MKKKVMRKTRKYEEGEGDRRIKGSEVESESGRKM